MKVQGQEIARLEGAGQVDKRRMGNNRTNRAKTNWFEYSANAAVGSIRVGADPGDNLESCGW